MARRLAVLLIIMPGLAVAGDDIPRVCNDKSRVMFARS